MFVEAFRPYHLPFGVGDLDRVVMVDATVNVGLLRRIVLEFLKIRWRSGGS